MRKNAGRSSMFIKTVSCVLVIVIQFTSHVHCEQQMDSSLKRISRSAYIPETNTYKYTSDIEASNKYDRLQKLRFSRISMNNTVFRLMQKNKNVTTGNLPTVTPFEAELTTLQVPFSFLLNASASPLIGRRIFDDIYDKQGNNESTRSERFQQIGSWLSDQDSVSTKAEMKVSSSVAIQDRISHDGPEPVKAHYPHHPPATDDAKNDDEYSSDYDDENGDGPSGTTKTPPCASHGRYYCSHNEDYPTKVVTEVTRYYKWPLEKLFRDMRQQVMPKLANDNFGGLVCDSVTRVVRPGWVKNTNNRWLVVINTEHYQQFVSEVICRHGSGTFCNFIPPCYHATCRQRYNTQKLLVIDPWNPYKGPFLSEFLFPSCCVCFVPDSSDSHYAASNDALQKRTEPAKSEL